MCLILDSITFAAAWNILQSLSVPSKHGGVAERLNAPVLKTGILERVSGVRIPPPPQRIKALSHQRWGFFVFASALRWQAYRQKVI